MATFNRKTEDKDTKSDFINISIVGKDGSKMSLPKGLVLSDNAKLQTLAKAIESGKTTFTVELSIYRADSAPTEVDFEFA